MRFALQREMTGLRIGMVVVEILKGPINDYDCIRATLFVLKKYLNL